jgi:prevent-host-death family protein
MPHAKLSLRPLSDLESRPSEVIRQIQDTGRPLVLTQNGREVAVLLSMEAFEDFRGEAERVDLQEAVEEAEREVTAGKWVEHAEVLGTLKQWAGEA